jgi:molybdate transport system substrate-binding protein
MNAVKPPTKKTYDARSRLAASFICLGVAIFLYGCTSSQSPRLHPLTIAAAADLRYALDETIAQFRPANTDIDIRPIYGSSGNFYTQIANSAPFDVFMSADMEYPRKLLQDGFAVEGSEFQYAVGRLVVWVRNDFPLDITQLGMETLINPYVKKVSIANPEHAPYGRAAVAAMQKAGIYGKVTDRLVFGENVSQALQFIEANAAEAGIVAMSLATAPTVKSRGKYFEIPLDSYPRMDQGGVILKQVRDGEAANRFRAFVLSSQGRAIFKQFGFYMPDESYR